MKSIVTRCPAQCGLLNHVVFSLLLLRALPAVVQAQYCYETNNGAVIITDYTGPGGAVTIPGTIELLPVTIIGYGAFSERWDVTRVTIPDSVTIVGDQVFEGCISLTNVTIPNSVISVGGGAFLGCSNLNTVVIPSQRPRRQL